MMIDDSSITIILILSLSIYSSSPYSSSDAVMHMYTHDKLWPALSDLAIALGSECNILDSDRLVSWYDSDDDDDDDEDSDCDCNDDRSGR
jgi:hypothetical protein